MVVSTETAQDVVVSWVPPPGAMASGVQFKVYGLAGGVLEDLGYAAYPTTTLTAPAGYLAYAVTTYVDGEESEPTWSCISSRLDPPPPIVAIRPDCGLSKYNGFAATKQVA